MAASSPRAGDCRTFAIAQRLEREGGDRYADLASCARAEGMLEVADLFERLPRRSASTNEASFPCRRKKEESRQILQQWSLPQTFDDEAAGELAVSRTVGAYRNLSMAVRNEERTFTFPPSSFARRPDPRRVRRPACH
jgi:hypothetical protein